MTTGHAEVNAVSIQRYTNMAKNIRWQIPFVSLSGVHYRIDIYDEGTFTPVTLTGGTNPFVTSEDDSDDYFAPIRTQSGTIEVCTLMPDGNYITLDDLLPANNIARPVRLINLDNSNAIEWQGFLSCEVYDQDYTSIPQIIQLPVISVLEAMASVEVELNESMAFRSIIAHLLYAMKAIETESGMLLFNNIYLSQYYSSEIVSKKIYNNIYFSLDEKVNGDNIVAEIHSVSCKKILEQVAQFFGGCWREGKRNLYLEAVGCDNTFDYKDFYSLYHGYVQNDNTVIWNTEATQSSNMIDCDWMGTDHKQDIRQGARRVKVDAKLQNFEINLGLQETPVSSLSENPDARQENWGEVHANENEGFYSLADHKHYSVIERTFHDPYDSNRKKATVRFDAWHSGIEYDETCFWQDNELLQKYNDMILTDSPNTDDEATHYVTSFMAYLREVKEDEENTQLKSGLMVCGLPVQFLLSSGGQYLHNDWFALSSDYYVYRQRSGLFFNASSGKLSLKANIMAVSTNHQTLQDFSQFNHQSGVTIAIRVGNQWVHRSGTAPDYTYSFENYFDTFFIRGDGDGKVEIDIPINSQVVGEVTLYVFPITGGDVFDTVPQSTFDVFLTDLSLDYDIDAELLSSRGSNVYSKDTDTAFRDEITVSVDIASDVYNEARASLLWEDETTPIRLLTLGGVTVRPEVDLLNRLASYYGASRKTLNLITKHPVVNNAPAVLPLLKLNGIGDGKHYLPLSESRDWREETCTLKCFEVPDDASES